MMAITQRTINRLWYDYRNEIIDKCCEHGALDDARDVCQELFTCLWQGRSRLRVPNRNALIRSALNLMLEKRRATSRDGRVKNALRATSIYSVYLGARRIEYIPPDIREGLGRCELCGERVWRIRLNWSMKIPWVQKRDLGRGHGPTDQRHYCKKRGKR
jgi:hypothetical protein